MVGFFILISALVLAFGQNQASRRQHEGMLRRIMRAPMSFFDTTPLGRIVNRFSRDVDVVDSMIPMNFRMWLNCVFNVVATITVVQYREIVHMFVNKNHCYRSVSVRRYSPRLSSLWLYFIISFRYVERPSCCGVA